MVGPEIAAEILRRNAAGQTWRRISRDLGVARNTIKAIVTAKPDKLEKRLRKPRLTIREEVQLMGRPYQRCPTCGALAQLPCLECRIESEAKAKRLLR